MSASQFKHQPLSSNNSESYSSWPEDPQSNSAAAVAIELGLALAESESAKPRPGLCYSCRNFLDPQTSAAEYPNIFCSQLCEQEFVHHALASLTVEDCIRIQARLESLLAGARHPIV